MPYVHLNVSRSLSPEQIDAAREAIAACMPLLPGKSRENTMIHISSGCALSIGDPETPCLFLEARLYKASPEEAKRAFVARLSKAFEELFGIAQKRMYMNVIELEHWGAGGAWN